MPFYFKKIIFTFTGKKIFVAIFLIFYDNTIVRYVSFN